VAKKKADTYKKQGLQNAIFQHQFEMREKEEENCFKDLFETLNDMLE
jgi:hypothetical protein